MKKLFAALVLGAGITACGSSEGPAGTSLPTELVGTWQATELTFSESNGDRQMEIVAAGGTATFVVGNDAKYALTITEAGDVPMIEEGAIEICATDVICLYLGGNEEEEDSFGYILTGDILELNGQAEYDFGDDGSVETAFVNGKFDRTPGVSQ